MNSKVWVVAALVVVMVVALALKSEPSLRWVSLSMFLVSVVLIGLILFGGIMKHSDVPEYREEVPCPECGAMMAPPPPSRGELWDRLMVYGGYLVLPLIAKQMIKSQATRDEWSEAMAVHRGESRGCPDCGWRPGDER